MAKNKKQQDVLDDLLCGTCLLDGDTPTAYKQLAELIYPLADSIIAKNSKRVYTSSPQFLPHKKKNNFHNEQKITKKKATYYVSLDVLDSLSEIKTRIRQLLPDKEKSRISKSKLVEYALRLILAEFETKEKESLIIKQINGRQTEE